MKRLLEFFVVINTEWSNKSNYIYVSNVGRKISSLFFFFFPFLFLLILFQFLESFLYFNINFKQLFSKINFFRQKFSIFFNAYLKMGEWAKKRQISTRKGYFSPSVMNSKFFNEFLDCHFRQSLSRISAGAVFVQGKFVWERKIKVFYLILFLGEISSICSYFRRKILYLLLFFKSLSHKTDIL